MAAHAYPVAEMRSCCMCSHNHLAATHVLSLHSGAACMHASSSESHAPASSTCVFLLPALPLRACRRGFHVSPAAFRKSPADASSRRTSTASLASSTANAPAPVPRSARASKSNVAASGSTSARRISA
eukprot:6178071-Pleurochrysis_carterae.AAC.2